MSEKKRTTVTTIETHEVWIVRKVNPEVSEVAALAADEHAHYVHRVEVKDEGSNQLKKGTNQRS